MLRAPIFPTLLASAFAALWTCVGSAATRPLQEDIEIILAEEGLTGVAWTLIGEHGEARFGSAGLQDNRVGTAFAPETRFHVGSLAKTLLATGVLRLATEGRIDVDAPALRYLPDRIADDAPAGFSAVTVRHLLDHTGGLNDAHLWQMFSERARPDSPLSAGFPDPAVQLQIRSRPGSRFAYSNMGYTLLGMVIESIVGDRYEAYLDKHLLAPLGMNESTFAFTTQEGDSADPLLAWGHVDDGSRYAASAIFLRPAGQFATTAPDLARFARFLLGNGVIDGKTFLDEAMMRSRGVPVGTEAANEGLIAGYALGLGRRDRHGVVGYCHGGNIVGFVAMLCVFPDELKAFGYSVNTDSETANYGRFDELFIQALGIAGAAVPSSVHPVSDVSDWHGRYVLSPNRFQTFEYLDTVFGAIRISADGDNLTLVAMQQADRQLRPVGERLYSADDRTTASHALYRGGQGEYLIGDGFRTYEKVPTAYLAAHWTSMLLGIAGLVWILAAGSISLFRHRAGGAWRPIAPAYVATLLLLAPLPFFLTQSFMALGDLTVASAMLAIVTLLLPIGMLLTMVLAAKDWSLSRTSLLHGLAAAFVLQWCAVLIVSGMLPLRLWA